MFSLRDEGHMIVHPRLRLCSLCVILMHGKRVLQHLYFCIMASSRADHASCKFFFSSCILPEVNVRWHWGLALLYRQIGPPGNVTLHSLKVTKILFFTTLKFTRNNDQTVKLIINWSVCSERKWQHRTHCPPPVLAFKQDFIHRVYPLRAFSISLGGTEIASSTHTHQVHTSSTHIKYSPGVSGFWFLNIKDFLVSEYHT